MTVRSYAAGQARAMDGLCLLAGLFAGCHERRWASRRGTPSAHGPLALYASDLHNQSWSVSRGGRGSSWTPAGGPGGTRTATWHSWWSGGEGGQASGTGPVGERLGTGWPARTWVHVIGYPDGEQWPPGGCGGSLPPEPAGP